MNNPAILHPMFALATWTALVLLLGIASRFRAVSRREAAVSDFRFGESNSVPTAVSIPNRNYMNLLEAPVLFYVVCLILYVTATASATAVQLAWTYVALRVAHSAVHLTYNRVVHRMSVFAASNAVLIALWVMAGLALYSGTASTP